MSVPDCGAAAPYPGYRPTDGDEPVARARRVKRRPRERCAAWLNSPEAMLRICPATGPQTAMNL
ncbi:hypothetical protein C6400_28530 [Klebsiella michiganensis]|nr:hypothetical protein [Klebsiella michiganensis]MBZ7505884.1 hypothetical protein [Klebsiella michiganensis]MBZ7602845.1 hypothetical protein [Klebsiella michiganensis]PSI96643.1 hypothetical protein C6400_28530 [Klebsiella michiganensis]